MTPLKKTIIYETNEWCHVRNFHKGIIITIPSQIPVAGLGLVRVLTKELVSGQKQYLLFVWMDAQLFMVI